MGDGALGGLECAALSFSVRGGWYDEKNCELPFCIDT